jgi:hypothetical protein
METDGWPFWRQKLLAHATVLWARRAGDEPGSKRVVFALEFVANQSANNSRTTKMAAQVPVAALATQLGAAVEHNCKNDVRPALARMPCTGLPIRCRRERLMAGKLYEPYRGTI